MSTPSMTRTSSRTTLVVTRLAITCLIIAFADRTIRYATLSHQRRSDPRALAQAPVRIALREFLYRQERWRRPQNASATPNIPASCVPIRYVLDSRIPRCVVVVCTQHRFRSVTVIVVSNAASCPLRHRPRPPISRTRPTSVDHATNVSTLTQAPHISQVVGVDDLIRIANVVPFTDHRLRRFLVELTSIAAKPGLTDRSDTATSTIAPHGRAVDLGSHLHMAGQTIKAASRLPIRRSTSPCAIRPRTAFQNLNVSGRHPLIEPSTSNTVNSR